MVLVYGHPVRVVEDIAGQDPDPPEWADWEALFVHGIRLFADSRPMSSPGTC